MKCFPKERIIVIQSLKKLRKMYHKARPQMIKGIVYAGRVLNPDGSNVVYGHHEHISVRFLVKTD